MNFANPYFFAAILDSIPHRFVLVMECESILGAEGFSPPRFSVGAVNAIKDPRFSSIKQLMEVGVTESGLQIPPGKQTIVNGLYMMYSKHTIMYLLTITRYSTFFL